MTLTFYPFGIILRRETVGGTVEHAVDPAAVAKALVDKLPEQAFTTGLLTSNTLFVWQKGEKRTVIEYRPPQKTGLWLEGSDEPVRVPLPGLIMVRSINGSITYRVLAVKQRPTDEKAKLFEAPLPNVSTGGVCWGTVPRPAVIDPTSLAEDWKLLLGSRFGNHSVAGKSKQHRDDIRKLYPTLEGAKSYPSKDLIATRFTLGKLMEDFK